MHNCIKTLLYRNILKYITPILITEVVGTSIKNGRLQNTSSGYTVGTGGLQRKARMAKEKLDGHHQTRSEEHGHYLG